MNHKQHIACIWYFIVVPLIFAGVVLMSLHIRGML